MQKIIKVLVQFSTLTVENMLYFFLEISMENTLTQSPTPKPVSNPVPVPTPQSNRSWLILVFSVFTLLLLASTGYLYYQNQQLKGMLASYQIQITPSPSPSQAPTGDLANWKTYASPKFGFSFRYPQSSTIKTDTLDIDGSLEFDNFILFVEKTNDTLVSYVNKLKDTNGASPVTKNIGDMQAIEWVGSFKNAPTHYLSIENKGYAYSFGVTPLDNMINLDLNNTNLLTQILSTFKSLDSGSNKIYTDKYFSIDTSIWKLLSDANQSPATPEVLETVAFENGQARMNIQVGTDTFEKVLASQDGEVVGNVVIDGATATKKSGYGGIAGSVYSVNLVLARQGKTYTIGFYTQDSKNIGDYEKKFNEVVSTFKFTQ